MNTIGERLRARRERLGLTQIELATRLAAVGMKCSQARISRFERGWTAPPADMIVSLARVLKTSIAELQSPTDHPLQRAEERDVVVLEASDVAWIIDRLPPPQRAELLARLRATESYAHIAGASGA